MTWEKTSEDISATTWYPTKNYIENSRLKAFIDRHHLLSYEDLLQKSTTNLEWFWTAIFKELDIQFYEPYKRIIDTSKGPAWPRWCVGGSLNIVHNCLDKWIDTTTKSKVAVQWEGEDGSTQALTYHQLYSETNRCANALLSLGVTKGDRVGLFMPMCPELVAAFFGTIKIGAIVVPLFSGYGDEAIATRLRDAEATVLITADGFQRRGKKILLKKVADRATASVPTVRSLIVVSRLGIDLPLKKGRDHRWDQLVNSQSDICATERTKADDPLMIIYTSGTTGNPKGTVHTHCGFPIKAAQDMMHGFDMHSTDTMYWVTDIGWMMGPWELFGTTLLGSTMLLYDGSLDWPAPDRLWQVVERHNLTILGVSPSLIRSLMHHGELPLKQSDLSLLRILGSTGETWNPEAWRWLFHNVGKGKIPIINYSGGTEVSGGLVVGNVLTPIKPCSFAGPPPGIDADVVDEEGRSIRNKIGELVVRTPWIGMTQGFWRDPTRYEQTYWSRFPNVWVHGDWATVKEDGLWYILGRTDDTIKLAGKRLGPAEVESILVKDPSVAEAAAIGVPHELKGQALVCFCVLNKGHKPNETLINNLKTLIAEHLGKPLKPEAIEFIPDLPKTKNAKVMRRVIRATYLGQPPGDLSSLENPEAIKFLKKNRTTLKD